MTNLRNKKREYNSRCYVWNKRHGIFQAECRQKLAKHGGLYTRVNSYCLQLVGIDKSINNDKKKNIDMNYLMSSSEKEKIIPNSLVITSDSLNNLNKAAILLSNSNFRMPYLKIKQKVPMKRTITFLEKRGLYHNPE